MLGEYMGNMGNNLPVPWVLNSKGVHSTTAPLKAPGYGWAVQAASTASGIRDMCSEGRHLTRRMRRVTMPPDPSIDRSARSRSRQRRVQAERSGGTAPANHPPLKTPRPDAEAHTIPGRTVSTALRLLCVLPPLHNSTGAWLPRFHVLQHRMYYDHASEGQIELQWTNPLPTPTSKTHGLTGYKCDVCNKAGSSSGLAWGIAACVGVLPVFDKASFSPTWCSNQLLAAGTGRPVAVFFGLPPAVCE